MLLGLCLSRANAQCVALSTPSVNQPQQVQWQTSPRLNSIEILKSTPEPEYLWRAHDPNPYEYLQERFSLEDILALVEYSQNALAPQAIDISGLENKPVDISLRLKPKQEYKGEPLAAPVPPPQPAGKSKAAPARVNDADKPAPRPNAKQKLK